MWTVWGSWLVCVPVWCQMSVRSCSQLLARNTKSIQSLCHPLSDCDGVLISNIPAINLTNRPGSTPRSRMSSTSGHVHEWKSWKVWVASRWLLSGFIEVKLVCGHVCVCVSLCVLNKQCIMQTCMESLKAKTLLLPPGGTERGGGCAHIWF